MKVGHVILQLTIGISHEELEDSIVERYHSSTCILYIEGSLVVDLLSSSDGSHKLGDTLRETLFAPNVSLLELCLESSICFNTCLSLLDLSLEGIPKRLSLNPSGHFLDSSCRGLHASSQRCLDLACDELLSLYSEVHHLVLSEHHHSLIHGLSGVLCHAHIVPCSPVDVTLLNAVTYGELTCSHLSVYAILSRRIGIGRGHSHSVAIGVDRYTSRNDRTVALLNGMSQSLQYINAIGNVDGL